MFAAAVGRTCSAVSSPFSGSGCSSVLVAVAEDLAFRGLGPRYALLVPILGLLVVLSVKPWGLFGTVEDMKRV